MSNEWLTTGQMIDRLKVGEVAEPNDKAFLKVKNIKGDFYWINSEGIISVIHHEPIRISEEVANLKWRILPKYVSFNEAMKARKEGKTVTLYVCGERMGKLSGVGNTNHLRNIDVGRCTIDDLLDGKWTIEAETP